MNLRFGTSVAIHHDRIAVGSAGVDFQQGSVHIFKREYARITNEEEWIPVSLLLSTDPENGAIFGDKVSIYGDYLVVGAGGQDEYTGSGYIFTRAGIFN